jgi:prephenate dehydrogenase
MKKPLFNRIAIVGVGLIGGSLGITIKKKRLARSVIGVVRKKRTIRKAFQLKALDAATLSLREGVRGADLVILCAPVQEIIRHIRSIAPCVGPGTLVIDVGSSKQEVLKAAARYLKRGAFVGCHPMAGSEKCGIENAKGGLFAGSVCFMTSHHPKIKAFWSALGAKPVHLNAGPHDRWAAKVSHLPHLLSFALLQNLERPVDRKFELNPSFRELARLAGSHPKVWTDILLTNRAALIGALRSFRKDLGRLEKGLRSGNIPSLMRSIVRANSNAAKVTS